MKRSHRPLLLLVAAASLLLLAGCSSPDRADGTSPEELWTCPMHPEYVADHPGTCPICNMDLVKKEAKPDPSGTGERPALELGPDSLRTAGVVTEAATVGRLARTIRASGSVVADERRLVRAQAKIAGWVERLEVNSTGQFVRKGAAAMAVYSPALLAAQSEYLLARDAANRFAGSQVPEVRRGGQDLLVAARRRLELLDVPESLIAELDRTRTTQRTVELLVPASGFVSEKAVVQGQEITPGMTLYTVTDLSTVWVEAAFFESEARFVAIGQTATLRLPYDERTAVTARIAYVYPTLDAAARTLTARFELPNPGFRLRPGMFVDVELEVGLGEGVLVPASAVLDSGLRKTVFVETSPGRLEPREVETGERSGDAVQIVRGVSAGERVATRANFLLDAESRIRGAGAREGSASAPREPK
jgi:Cu(I)/Ag(I) efflux system membrane fusion protein